MSELGLRLVVRQLVWMKSTVFWFDDLPQQSSESVVKIEGANTRITPNKCCFLLVVSAAINGFHYGPFHFAFGCAHLVITCNEFYYLCKMMNSSLSAAWEV